MKIWWKQVHEDDGANANSDNHIWLSIDNITHL